MLLYDTFRHFLLLAGSDSDEHLAWSQQLLLLLLHAPGISVWVRALRQNHCCAGWATGSADGSAWAEQTCRVQKPGSWYSRAILQERPRVRRRPVNLTQYTYKSYICPLSDGSVPCHRQARHSQTHVCSFPPWTLCQIQTIKPADKFYPARGLRKQESLAAHRSLATAVATPHVAQVKGNLYRSASPDTEEDTLLKHDTCQMWAKTPSPAPRPPEKQTNPVLAAGTTRAALQRHRATAC